MDLSTMYKAIGGGVAGAIIALVAHFGFQPDPATTTALSVVVTAVVGYCGAHLTVYFFPKNK